eukprot:m.8745 g.8745  ORF g.8745 m.8745 type:complete len:175 (+) comp20808_c0_seq1:452-976(+)
MFRCIPIGLMRQGRVGHDNDDDGGPYFNPYVNSWTSEASSPVTVRYSLSDRILVYAVDLKNITGCPIKDQIYGDPFFLPTDLFTDEEKKEMLHRYDFFMAKSYQQALEERTLDRRGQLSAATDILPLIKRFFHLRGENLESSSVRNKHKTMHRELRRQKSFKVEKRSVIVEHVV